MEKRIEGNNKVEAIIKKWEMNSSDKNGNLQANVFFGEAAEEGIKDGLLIWMRTTAPIYMDVLENILEAIPNDAIARIKVYTETNSRIEINDKCESITDYYEAIKNLATTKRIVFIGRAPAFFSKREAQVVVSVYGDQMLRKGAIRNDGARHTISGFLNSDLIINIESKENNDIAEIFQLGGLFQGLYITKSIDCIGNTIFEFYNNEYFEDTHKLSSNKKHLIILFDWGLEKSMNYLLQLLELIDYNQTDVTLLTYRRPQGFIQEAREELIDARVRIMYRVNTFSCNKQSFVDIQSKLDFLRNEDDLELIDKRLGDISEEVMENEAKRLLGCAKFDSLIFMMNDDLMWKLLSRKIPSSSRRIIIGDNYGNYPNIDNANNAVKDKDIIINNHCFDTFIFTSKKIANKMAELYNKDKIGVWEIPALIKKEKENKANLIYRGVNRIVLGSYSDKIASIGTFLKAPKENERCVAVSADIIGLDQIVRFFENTKHNYDGLYIIGDIDQEIRLLARQSPRCSDIVLIDKWAIMPFESEGLFMHFVECWTTDDQIDGIYLICEELGIKVFNIIETGKEPVNCHSSNLSYEEYCKNMAYKIAFSN